MEVDKHVAMPVPRLYLLLPYASLEVGDSFFVANQTLQRICNANYRYAKRTGKKFTARKQDGGIRVWRTA